MGSVSSASAGLAARAKINPRSAGDGIRDKGIRVPRVAGETPTCRALGAPHRRKFPENRNAPRAAPRARRPNRPPPARHPGWRRSPAERCRRRSLLERGSGGFGLSLMRDSDTSRTSRIPALPLLGTTGTSAKPVPRPCTAWLFKNSNAPARTVGHYRRKQLIQMVFYI